MPRWERAPGSGRDAALQLRVLGTELARPQGAGGEGGGMNSDPGRPNLSVVIVNWNTQEKLHDCLSSIAEHLRAVAHEVIVIDNDSNDGSPEMVEEEFADVRLVRNTDNVGFGRANNQGM